MKKDVTIISTDKNGLRDFRGINRTLQAARKECRDLKKEGHTKICLDWNWIDNDGEPIEDELFTENF